MAENLVLRNDIKEIVAPEIDPKLFGTSEKRIPGLQLAPDEVPCSSQLLLWNKVKVDCSLI